jgi:hypothetical protein
MSKFVDRNISIGIAIRCGLDGPGIKSRWVLDFTHPSRWALEAYPEQWVPFSGGKVAGAWRWPLTQSSAEFKKKGWAIPLVPYWAFVGPSERAGKDSPAEMWIRIPPGVWISVSCEFCVIRWRSLRRTDNSSRGVLPGVMRRCVWDLEPSSMRRPWPAWGHSATEKKEPYRKFLIKIRGFWRRRISIDLTDILDTVCRLRLQIY